MITLSTRDGTTTLYRGQSTPPTALPRSTKDIPHD